MNGYELTRAWYNFKFQNPKKVKAAHSDMFFYIVDLWNRLGQKKHFGLPTTITMEALGVGSYNTYKNTLNDLFSFGFIKLISDSKNQHQSKIIALSKIDKATDEALDKATIKATDEALDKATDTIIEQRNKGTIEQRNKEREKKFSPPTLLEVQELIQEKKYGVNANSFWNFYESKNWYVGKNKMKDWKKALAGWDSREKDNLNKNQNGKSNNNNGTKQAYEFSVDRVIETYAGNS